MKEHTKEEGTFVLAQSNTQNLVQNAPLLNILTQGTKQTNKKPHTHTKNHNKKLNQTKTKKTTKKEAQTAIELHRNKELC